VTKPKPGQILSAAVKMKMMKGMTKLLQLLDEEKGFSVPVENLGGTEIQNITGIQGVGNERPQRQVSVQPILQEATTWKL
jgi:hypothetical protein